MLLAIPSGLLLAINILATACIVITLVFTIILIQKYRKKRSTAMRYLMIGFLFFIIAGLVAIPIAFTSSEIIKKMAYMAAKILMTFASIYFINFIIAIFSPSNEGSLPVQRAKLIYVLLNLVMIIAYHLVVIYTLTITTSPDNSGILWLIFVQGITTAVPFAWLGFSAFKVARRVNLLNEQRAIQFISLSGFALASFFVFNAINDSVGTSNPWTLPAWVGAIVAVFSLYIGLVRPAFIFHRYDRKG